MYRWPYIYGEACADRSEARFVGKVVAGADSLIP